MGAEKAKEEMTEQLNSLTDEEKYVVTCWTGALAHKVNHVIDHNISLEKYSHDMKLLDSAISKGCIPIELTLRFNAV